MPKIVALLLFYNSRKVGFGFWLFIVSTILLFRHLIQADHWMLCMALSATLIGGGTVADGWLKVKGGQNVPPTPIA